MSEAESRRADPSSGGQEGEGEAGKAFRVIDRRRIAPDGSERTSGEDEPGPAAQAAASAEGARDPAGERVRPPGDPSPPYAGPQGGEFVMSDAEAQGRGAVAEVTISTLFLSLSTQALMHLGEIPDLTTGEPARDLQAARSIIDLLGVLEEKTRGNLDGAEAGLLERVLYDLRMRFVEIARR